MMKFRVVDIAEAIGRTESAVRSAASAKGWPTRKGLDITQIKEIAELKQRNQELRKIDPEAVKLIQMTLEAIREYEREHDEFSE